MEIKFAHFRNIGQGVTVAFDDSKMPDQLWLAVARCSPRDNFCRKIGRDVSSGRFKAGKNTMLINPAQGLKPYEIIEDYLRTEHEPPY